MAYLQFHGTQYPVPAEGLTVGCHDGAALRLPGDDSTVRAVVTVAADGSAVIRRDAADAVILVNGVQLGLEPSPLLHGDKVEMAGEELRFGDVKAGGSTQFVSGAQVAEMARARAAGAPAKPTLARGGRLVSLTDGREYVVPDDGVTIGREVGNDVVIASSEVSRKHAEIVPMPGGYHLNDLSTNGVFVNGVRIEQKQVLGRGDVIKIGPEEFRFYADQAKAATAPPPPAPAPVMAPPVPPTPAPTPVAAPVAAAPAAPPKVPEVALDLESAIASAAVPTPPVPSAHAPSAPTPVAATPAAPKAPASAAPAGRAPLATLEIVNEGPLKGTKFEIHSALTNVGRGAHNDIVLNDESVSDSHAKIQRRENGWFIVDQESTNGTYVGGRRVQGEHRVEGAPDVRFGGIKMTFRPVAVAGDEAGGTRAIAAVSVDQARKSTVAKPAAPVPAESSKKGCGAMIAFLMTAAAAGASLLAILFSTGR
ncbi:MAG TPA: FHA domain-containing protein [Gemmatimonadaceae bacterium]|jgi:pSer/pThr/pTyr-binding forkhead associated (FHA) protein